MALAQLDGPDKEIVIGNFFTDVAKDVKKTTTAVSTAVKKAATAVSTDVKKVEKAVVTVGAAPARAAALLIIDADTLGIAKSLAAAYKQSPQKVKDFWTGLGGNPSDLVAAINKGAGTSLSGLYSMGAEKSTIGADLGQEVAAPIVHAIMTFLLALGIPVPPAVATAVDNFIAGAVDTIAGKKGVSTIVVPANAQAGIVGGGSGGGIPLVPILGIAALGGLALFLLND